MFLLLLFCSLPKAHTTREGQKRSPKRSQLPAWAQATGKITGHFSLGILLFSKFEDALLKGEPSEMPQLLRPRMTRGSSRLQVWLQSRDEHRHLHSQHSPAPRQQTREHLTRDVHAPRMNHISSRVSTGKLTLHRSRKVLHLDGAQP
jgi:hypothetical protein